MTKRNRVSSTLGAYEDIRRLLDVVLREGSCDLDCATSGEAVSLRHRVYLFRSMLLKKAQADIDMLLEKGLVEPGTLPSSPYDRIYIQLDGTTVKFRLRDGKSYVPRLRRADGSAIETLDDPLVAEAEAFAKNLRLE